MVRVTHSVSFNCIDYKFKQRYLLEVILYAKDHFKFQKENRFGRLHSVSGGWIISDEAYGGLLFHCCSYGETGNQNILWKDLKESV